MNNFIEVHLLDTGEPVLINLSHIDEIQPSNVPESGGTAIYFAFASAGCGRYFIMAKESYDKIKLLIWR